MSTGNNVPRNIERRIESGANVRGLDVKSIELEEENEDGSVYKVVINDEDAEEGENPAFFVLHPNEPGRQGMFGDRLDRKLSAVRKKLLGVKDDIDQKLEETRQEMEDRDIPDEDVEYGPGPKPNVEGAVGGYDDGDVRVESTSDIDLSEIAEQASQHDGEIVTEEEARSEPDASSSTNDTNTTTNNDTDTMTTKENILPDDFYGDVADAVLDARELSEKGHDTAAEALLKEVQEDIDAQLEGDGDE